MLILILVVLVVLALSLYCVRLLPGLDGTISLILQIVLVVIAIAIIVQRSGLAFR